MMTLEKFLFACSTTCEVHVKRAFQTLASITYYQNEDSWELVQKVLKDYLEWYVFDFQFQMNYLNVPTLFIDVIPN